jgi:hypothetical protein
MLEFMCRLRLKCDGTCAETRLRLSTKRTSPFKSAGALVQSATGRRAVRISLQGLYCSCKPVFCSHVTLTGYPLHSFVSPSLLLPCVTVCHHITFQLDSTSVGFKRNSVIRLWSNLKFSLIDYHFDNFDSAVILMPQLTANFPITRTMRRLYLTLHITWVSNPRFVKLYYAARGYICKLHIYYKNHTVIYAFRYTTYSYFSTCGRRTSPQQPLWPFATNSLDAHDISVSFLWLSYSHCTDSCVVIR